MNATNPRRSVMVLSLLLVGLILLVYSNSFSGATIYDDRTAIIENPSIRQLWPASAVLSPPLESGTAGRPLANFTFALNYAIGGYQTWGYHFFNLACHTIAALALFGLVRRALELPGLHDRFAGSAVSLAFGASVLWALHPVATQTVAYLSQRTEGLMGMFFLLTLYSFVRGCASNSRSWMFAAVAACWAGTFCKEVMATAPLIALVFDACFVSGAFGAAWRARSQVYLAMFASWIPLTVLLVGVSHRGVGFGAPVSMMDYALTQCRAVAIYLTTGAWPNPLVFDYGLDLVQRMSDVWPSIGIVAVLLVVTTAGIMRSMKFAFLSVWFLVILGPTSTIIPIHHQPIALNRLYLPLAAVTVAGTIAAHRLFGSRTGWIGAGLALSLGAVTHEHIGIFRSELAAWSDTVRKVPTNARAFYNMGVSLDLAGRRTEAMRGYEAAIALRPAYAEAQSNLGNALTTVGRPAEAIPHLERAIRLKPDFPDAHYNLANALRETSQLDKAIAHYRIAARLEPTDAQISHNLGTSLLQAGHPAAARLVLERTVQLGPNSADAHANLAVALSSLGLMAGAIMECEAAIRIDPDHRIAQANLQLFRTQVTSGNAAR